MDPIEIAILVILLPVIYKLYKELGVMLDLKKGKAENTRIREVIAIIRNGKVLEVKKKARLLEDGSLLVDNDKLYKLPKIDPYIIKGVGFGAKQCFIVDANTQALYEFGDPLDVEDKFGNLNPVVLNPRTLYYYIASKSISKLLGKVTVSKGEAILYMFTGMVIIILLIFFILPLLGHEIIIR